MIQIKQFMEFPYIKIQPRYGTHFKEAQRGLTHTLLYANEIGAVNMKY